MGQYYMPYIKKGNKVKIFYSHDYNNGLKLMEHSYINNNFVNVIANEITEKPCRVVWVGDYAELEDFKNCTEKQAEKVIKKAWKDEQQPLVKDGKQEFDWYFLSHYLVNFDKKEYIYMGGKRNKWGNIISPLPLLTAVGNGKGGGDYRGINMNKVGLWAYDRLQLMIEPPKKYKQVFIEFREV